MNLKQHKFAIFLMVGNVEGGGGVERFFINFVQFNKNNEVDIITTRESKKNILKLCPGFPENRIKSFPVINNRFSYAISTFFISLILKKNNYSLIHIANFDSYYEPIYRFMTNKKKVSLNIIDCRFNPEFSDIRYDKIKKFISSGNLTAIFSWYKNAKEAVTGLNKVIFFQPATVCFTDYEKFKAQKKRNVVVFAARLSSFKRPDHFLKAVSICLTKNTELSKTWEFMLWGDGEMASEVNKLISDLHLETKVKTGFSKDMSEIFNTSSIFVSTQMYENFTSLSMLEAMASGNAIVAYDLGQTDFFVKDGINGILVKNESPDELAVALERLMVTPDLLKKYQNESVSLAKETHTIENFSNELFSFWETALKQK
ncbi:MAG: glycosyltransferase family 4 protein [Bacteroidia bacterium]|nr:glycosyltransferase family 4 protein [Bacteroidia bacterium]